MGKPIATTAGGTCFAFPDVCQTLMPPPPGNQVPVPYSNTGQLSDAVNVTTTVKVKNSAVITSNSQIPQTTGNEAAVPPNKGRVEFKTYSQTVKAQGANVVRMFDTTSQNAGNATGQVLGGETTVLVGD
jgi:hypothetical protein